MIDGRPMGLPAERPVSAGGGLLVAGCVKMTISSGANRRGGFMRQQIDLERRGSG